MAAIVHTRMSRLYAGPRTTTGITGGGLQQTMVSAVLSSYAAALPADSSGNVTSYAAASTTLKITVGGQDTTSLWTISRVNGAGVTSTLTGAVLTVTSLTADASYIDITAIRSGFDSITTRYSVSRVKSGAAGANGTNGVAGDWVSYVFKESATQPTTPTGTATIPAGWLDAPPATYTNPIWMSKATVNGVAGTAGTWSAPIKTTGVDGANGSNGSYVVFQYAKNSSLTVAPASGWASTPSTLATGEFQWMRSGTVTPPATAPAAWDTPYRVSGEKGDSGLNGTRTAILDMYQWSATEPTSFPVGTSTYTWSTGQFTSPATLNGWALTPPAPVVGQTLWIARQIYTDSNTSSTSSVTWSVASAKSLTMSGANGSNGTRTAVLEVYKWAVSTPTTFPSGTSTYTWATGAFTAPTTTNGWSLTPGAAVAGQTLWACSVTYADTSTTATSSVTWGTSTAYAVGAAGNDGAPGSPGSPGSAGIRGTIATKISGAWSDSTANAQIAAVATSSGGTPTTPIKGDIVYYTGGAKEYTGSAWGAVSAFIDGSLVVSGTIAADNIAAGTMTGSTIRTTSGSTRVEMNASSNALKVYAAGTEVLSLGGLGTAALTTTTITGVPGVIASSATTTTAIQVNSTGSGSGITINASSGNALECSSSSGYGLRVTGGGANITGNLNVAGTITGTLSYSSIVGGLGFTPVSSSGSVSYATSAGSASSASSATSATYAQYLNYSGGAYMQTGSYKAVMQTDGNFVVYGVSTWGAGTNVSDRRLKENINPTKLSGLEVINRLSVVDFEWKTLSRMWDGGKKHTGFIAQDVRDVIADAVTESGGTCFLHKEEIVPFLVKAIQELQTEIKLLKEGKNA